MCIISVTNCYLIKHYDLQRLGSSLIKCVVLKFVCAYKTLMGFFAHFYQKCTKDQKLLPWLLLFEGVHDVILCPLRMLILAFFLKLLMRRTFPRKILAFHGKKRNGQKCRGAKT